eukprot:2351172-Rhodomonas_salina.3
MRSIGEVTGSSTCSNGEFRCSKKKSWTDASQCSACCSWRKHVTCTQSQGQAAVPGRGGGEGVQRMRAKERTG